MQKDHLNKQLFLYHIIKIGVKAMNKQEIFDKLNNELQNILRDGEYGQFIDVCAEVPLESKNNKDYALRVWGEENNEVDRFFSVSIYDTNNFEELFEVYSDSESIDDLKISVLNVLERYESEVVQQPSSELGEGEHLNSKNTVENLYLYEISADNGESFTKQWLTKDEADKHKHEGFQVFPINLQPYRIAITETLTREVEIYAQNYLEAKATAEKIYKGGVIVLNHNDHVDTVFDCFGSTRPIDLELNDVYNQTGQLIKKKTVDKAINKEKSPLAEQIASATSRASERVLNPSEKDIKINPEH